MNVRDVIVNMGLWVRESSKWEKNSPYTYPFRVGFGVSGGVGVGVGERVFCKGKEYHYSNLLILKNLQKQSDSLPVYELSKISRISTSPRISRKCGHCALLASKL